MTILTSPNDDFLYERLIELLQQIKLVNGGTELAYTLRRHKNIRDYCKEKQIKQLKHIEDTYFIKDSLNTLAIDTYLQNKSLQK